MDCRDRRQAECGRRSLDPVPPESSAVFPRATLSRDLCPPRGTRFHQPQEALREAFERQRSSSATEGSAAGLENRGMNSFWQSPSRIAFQSELPVRSNPSTAVLPTIQPDVPLLPPLPSVST